jgi:hypothetical protein
MKKEQLIKRLAQLAVKWEQASERLAVDEPDDMDTVEDDTMSAIYGEAAGELRKLLTDERTARTGFDTLWEPVQATENATLLLAPGEEYANGTTKVPDDNRTWGMVIGDPEKVALVLLGTRDEIVQQLRDAQREIDNSYGAEHENALHEEYEGRCPACQAHGPTQMLDAYPGPHSDAVAAALGRDLAKHLREHGDAEAEPLPKWRAGERQLNPADLRKKR